MCNVGFGVRKNRYTHISFGMDNTYLLSIKITKSNKRSPYISQCCTFNELQTRCFVFNMKDFWVLYPIAIGNSTAFMWLLSIRQEYWYRIFSEGEEFAIKIVDTLTGCSIDNFYRKSKKIAMQCRKISKNVAIFM